MSIADEKSTLQGKTSSLKNTTNRQLSVIISEQQLRTESPEFRSGKATASRGTHRDTVAQSKREKLPDVSKMAASSSQCSTLSQHSLTRHQPHLTATTSRTTTRIDWYKLNEEQSRESRSTLSKTDQWFGYGGGPRISIEVLDQSFQVSPGFGCLFVGTSCVAMMKEIPESFKVC